MTAYTCPETGAPLAADTPHSLAADGRRYPLAAGVPYLRAGRPDLAAEALGYLDCGDEAAAVAVLLRDQDPFAPLPPPDLTVTRTLAAAGPELMFCAAMRALNFGPVADYFHHRASVPTYLSGLALLGRAARPGGTVVEVACGVGHYLRDLGHHGVRAVGVDLVFAKLWLARRFVCPRGELVCGDAARPPVRVAGPAVAFCHDAFYFLPDKCAAAEALRNLAGDDGTVLVGHAHNGLVCHGVAGTPRPPAEYAALFPGAALFDDEECGDRGCGAWVRSAVPFHGRTRRRRRGRAGRRPPPRRAARLRGPAAGRAAPVEPAARAGRPRRAFTRVAERAVRAGVRRGGGIPNV